MSKSIEKFTKRGVRTSYVSTTVGMSLVLFVIGIIFAGAIGINAAQIQAKESLKGDVFFSAEMNDASIKQVELSLKSWPEFKRIWFVSSERALQEFGDVGKEDIKQLFDGENPIPPSLCFSPNEKFANKTGMKNIKQKLLKSYPQQIIEVNYDESSVENVNSGFQQFILLFLLLALLLIIIAVAMINNTNRISLYSKRFTIKTMTLVGATRGYIRRPYLFQAALQGFIASLLAFGLLISVSYGLNNILDAIEIVFSWKLLVIIIAFQMSLGIFITLISTWFALNKYLRIKLDDLY